MNARRLLELYERILEAPDAIPRLRRFVFDLAVRGKLVRQDRRDEPASELLKRLTQLTGRDAFANQDDVPFRLPPGWECSSVGQLTTKTGSGSTPRGGKEVYRKQGIPFLRSQNIHNEGLRLGEVAYIDESTHMRMSGTAVAPGDLLLNITGGSIGRCCRLGEGQFVANISQHVAIIRLALREMGGYIHAVVLSPYFQKYVIDEQTGAGRGGLPKNRMDRIPVPVPPLAEQQRIVSRLDELMTLCDRIDAARKGREATRYKLTAASLARLSAPDPDTFRDDAGFVLDVLPALTARPDQIKRLRQTILNLAVRGKLTPQEPKDGPASELLKRIAAERDSLVDEGAIRREKILDPVGLDDLPFELPSNWVWSRIGSAVLFTQYGTSERSEPGDTGVPVLTMGNIQNGLAIWGNDKRIPESSNDLPALYLHKFDILYNRTNSAELVGKTGIYLGENDVRTFASYLIRIRTSLTHGCPRYLNLAMNSPVFRESQIVPLIKKQTGQANVNGTALRNMLVPLPPLAEQRRIVAKVHELMALCDRLEASVVAADDARGRLLEALLAEALAPTENLTSMAPTQLAAHG